MATQNTPDFKGSSNSDVQGQQQQQPSSIQDKASGLLSGLNGQLKTFGDSAAGQLGKLSTTQKVVGGLALAAGISWLSKAMNKRSA
ncbi:hypothetical protein [Hymenobacter jeollabukensis]|uniref:Uncharacterized protein n=1 Tax=Hymenobacter jeollabukensis TaxID=2025313 RepID=A0A5R8WUJ1_9BACT|nr:hypothetical protein [Hymenobacter jeollabukensis]TLM95430.1 hypothetical protein FDY95_06480 [Hymenobacter jeollabukensis]